MTTTTNLDKATEILAAGRLIAARKAPYFRALLLSFVLREAPGLGTVGVTKHRIFLWDPEFVAAQSPEAMGGLWLHESLHALNKHGHRIGARHPVIWNWACDLAINPAIREMGAVLPSGAHAGLFPSTLHQGPLGKQLGLKAPLAEGLTADEYYELLDAAAQKQLGESEVGEGDAPQAAGGFCGSCAGRPMPDEPKDGDPDGRGEGEMDRTNREVAEEIAERAKSKGIGSVPASLRRWAELALKPPTIPWRTKLAQITRRAVAWRPGAVDHRYDGPSRRQAGLGFGVGRPVLPRLRAPVPRVALVVDTSGSMGTKEIADCLHEAQGILEAVGAEVEFVACDADVHELRPVATVREMMGLLTGGGGTDFRPAFAALEHRRPKAEVIIFATDGYGPAPAHAPHGVNVIWLLVGGNERAPAPWGEVVIVKDEPED